MQRSGHTYSGTPGGNIGAARLLTAILAVCCIVDAAAQTPPRHVTQGRAKTVVDDLYKCPVKVRNHRVSAVGEIRATDGAAITVPASTVFQQGSALKGADLYNECSEVTPQRSAEVTSAKAGIVEVDRDGEVITGYIVADNYFELYVNGKLVAIDAVPYTPFNSTIVRFKVKRPITYAFKVVDWEEDLGLGSETYRGKAFHPGDGGLIARFSDGTVTDRSWKAQSFYIAPLDSPDDVIERGNVHDTTALGRVHPKAKVPGCGERCYAVHYAIPNDWSAPAFDDASWPPAYEYTDEDIGVTGLPAYTRYPELFSGAHWIWTANLVFDNVILARKTVR